LRDVQSLLQSGLVQKDRLWEKFQQIEPQLIRYPAVDPATLRAAVSEFCHA